MAMPGEFINERERAGDLVRSHETPGAGCIAGLLRTRVCKWPIDIEVSGLDLPAARLERLSLARTRRKDVHCEGDRFSTRFSITVP